MAFMKKTYNVDPVYEAQMQETDLDFRAHLLKIKSVGADVLAIGGQIDAISRISQQSIEVGIPSKVRRVAASAASNAPVPELAGDAVVGLIYAAAFNCKDERPVAQAFVKLVNEKYKVRCPDHDFSQAYETAQIIKQALTNAKLTLTDASLKDDRARDPRCARQHQELHRARVRPDQLLRRPDAAVPRRQQDRHPGRVHQGRQGLRHPRAGTRVVRARLRPVSRLRSAP